jgi:hypothetical protein
MGSADAGVLLADTHQNQAVFLRTIAVAKGTHT